MADIKRIIEEYLQEQMLPVPFGSQDPRPFGDGDADETNIFLGNGKPWEIPADLLPDDVDLLGSYPKPRTPELPDWATDLEIANTRMPRLGKGNRLYGSQQGGDDEGVNIGGLPKP